VVMVGGTIRLVLLSVNLGTEVDDMSEEVSVSLTVAGMLKANGLDKEEMVG